MPRFFAASVREMTGWTACRRTNIHTRGKRGVHDNTRRIGGPGFGGGGRNPDALGHSQGAAHDRRRSMLAHCLYSIAKVAPQHLVVVLGHDHDRIAPVVAELADSLGRRIDVALQDRQLGTGHAVLCGLSALPADYSGVVVVTSADIPCWTPTRWLT
ncbi:bifunctional glmU domain protein [Mycobacterium xenopi 4042]|uniref:Bifunctional glmU domain protein n=1 Tax=Mycobacterium xenopi 4042 TaxID=1299334 RepID=X8AG05_MYCXE|nr:bifunctional glmU domain protein [Mycobacterium xenopi 4042]